MGIGEFLPPVSSAVCLSRPAPCCPWGADFSLGSIGCMAFFESGAMWSLQAPPEASPGSLRSGEGGGPSVDVGAPHRGGPGRGHLRVSPCAHQASERQARWRARWPFISENPPTDSFFSRLDFRKYTFDVKNKEGHVLKISG